MSTSQQVESWRKTQSELGPRQREVLELLNRHPGGLSAWQLSDKLGRLIHATRPRITELVASGWVRQSGERWEPRTERHEAIWRSVTFDATGQLTWL